MLPKECGLFGICGQELVTTTKYQQSNQELIYNCLHNLQHRGQDSFGYSYQFGNRLLTHHYSGLVEMNKIIKINSFSKLNLIGHLRYMTSGKSSDEALNIQPFVSQQGFTISHNGNSKNTELLHKSLMSLTPNLSQAELDELKDRNHDT